MKSIAVRHYARWIAALAAIAIAGAAIFLSLPRTHEAQDLRTILAASSETAVPAELSDWNCMHPTATCLNGRDGTLLVEIVNGTVPATEATAEVLTDTDCAPDRYGVSHCHNVLRLPNGQEVEVRHDHNMQQDPCLSPGEKVHLKLLT